ncbi:MAG: hypothetical protein WAW86_08620 [Gammaproteobacteria bacterium]
MPRVYSICGRYKSSTGEDCPISGESHRRAQELSDNKNEAESRLANCVSAQLIPFLSMFLVVCQQEKQDLDQASKQMKAYTKMNARSGF